MNLKPKTSFIKPQVSPSGPPEKSSPALHRQDSLKGRRTRGPGAPKHMIGELQHMAGAAAAKGMGIHSASLDTDFEDGSPSLRMTFKRRTKGKAQKAAPVDADNDAD